MSEFLCTGIVALAGTENADLRSQDDFKGCVWGCVRGNKIANLPT